MSLTSTTASLGAHQWRGVIEEYRDRLDIPESHAHHHAARGRHAAGRQPVAVRADRCAGLAEGRGRQPHRLVQGPRHDGRAVVRGRRGRRGGGVRVDRQHVRVDGGVRRAGRRQAAGAGAAGQDRGRQAGAGDRARRAGDHGARQLRRLPADLARPRRGLPGRAGELRQPDAPRGPEDRVVRDRRLPRRRPRRARAAGRQRRQHLGVLEGLPASTSSAGRATRTPQMLGWQAAGAAPLVSGVPVAAPETVASAIRIGNPASWQLAVAAAGRVRRRASGPSPTSRSSPRSASSRPATASSSSRRPPPASPACSPSWSRRSSPDAMPARRWW